MKSPVPVVAALALALLAGCAGSTSSVHRVVPRPGAQTPQSFSEVVTKTNAYQYLLYVPKDYDANPTKQWPLVLFLHGAGERGTNLTKVAVHGPPKLVGQGRQFPFILASPQCPEGKVWDDEALLGLLHRLETEMHVDTKRVYVTGLSMGGYGTWALASRHPEHFAAVAPVCGGRRSHPGAPARAKGRVEDTRGLGIPRRQGRRRAAVRKRAHGRVVPEGQGHRYQADDVSRRRP